MNRETARAALEQGSTALGLELGSSRIKAVLIGEDHVPLASGAFDWENRLENGLWTYSLPDAWKGMQTAYRALKEEVREKYGVTLRRVGVMGVSAMMHGYLPFDGEGGQLAEFRTWRNTVTEEEARELTQLFGFNIPQRWSIAHLWRAVKNGEEHAPRIAHLTTLAGYVHWKLTGEKVLGVGEASGMFPIDHVTGDFHGEMVQKFNGLLREKGMPWSLHEILPRVLSAGEDGGALTEEGAALLDPQGDLEPGIPLCPPEGDAGTGMAATNSVSPRTGNVSAGTSIFAMAVLERPLSRVYTEIDMVTTPEGLPVAMVHCNTCTSDLDAWVRLFGEVLEAAGTPLEKGKLYDLFYRKALEGNPDCGGLLSYNFYSGEPVLGLETGCPLFARRPDAPLHFGDFARTQLYAALGALKKGMDLLLREEKISLDKLYGHGGLFKVQGVGQRLMAGALNVPTAVMETAGEGGPWGMALLAMYRKRKEPGETLGSYLQHKVFDSSSGECALPRKGDVSGFNAYMDRYMAGLEAEKAAAGALLPAVKEI